MKPLNAYDKYDPGDWTQKELKQLAYDVVGAAIEVHKVLGPGLLESIYEACFVHELKLRGFQVDQQVRVPLIYKGQQLRDELVLDVLVEDVLIVELKATSKLHEVHEAQLLSYMDLSAKPRGVLINFKVDNITRSAVHLVNFYFELHE